MVEEKKEEVWEIEAEARMLFRVAFERPVTKEEAKELFNRGQYYDIMDEEMLYSAAIGVED